jgi:hypothetical protein
VASTRPRATQTTTSAGPRATQPTTSAGPSDTQPTARVNHEHSGRVDARVAAVCACPGPIGRVTAREERVARGHRILRRPSSKNSKFLMGTVSKWVEIPNSKKKKLRIKKLKIKILGFFFKVKKNQIWVYIKHLNFD